MAAASSAAVGRVTPPVKFFIPQTKSTNSELVYEGIIDILKDQLRFPITERRIFSLEYTHDKKEYYVEVGQLEDQENRYQVLAIFESNPFIVFTRAADGGAGVTILVSKDEVTTIVDFE